MNLLIDIGNTRVKYALEDNGKIQTVQHCSVDKLFERLPGFAGLTQIVLVCVSNQRVANRIAQWAENRAISFKQVITKATEFSVTNSYPEHSTMGADRWVAIIAANALYPGKNILIIDSGTATTFDMVNKDHNHLGGWIIPGIEMMMNSLFANTDKVFGEVGDTAHTEFADNTSANVNHGCWAATLGAIDVARENAKKKGFPIEKIIFTGGNGQRLQSLLGEKSEFIDNLIFIGLQRHLG